VLLRQVWVTPLPTGP